MSKPRVFLSHIHEERELAQVVKDELLDGHLLGVADTFVSSDNGVNIGGQSWLKNVEDALQHSCVFLILASPVSVLRPWVNIEAGAGWVRQLMAAAAGNDEIYVMPLCHSGQAMSSLPKPWDTLNAVELGTIRGLQEILNVVGRVAKLRIPQPNFDSLRERITVLERYYSYFSRIEQSVCRVLTLFPGFRQVFEGRVSPPNLASSGFNLAPHDVGSIERDLSHLASEGLLVFRKNGTMSSVSAGGSVTLTELSMNVTVKYLTEVLGRITLP